MVDMTAIAGVAGSLNSAGQILKALLGMNIDHEVRAKVAELQGEIISAQSAALSSLAERAALLSRVEELEAEIRAGRSWEAEASRYELQQFPAGPQAYALIPEKANGEPIHKLCPACFQKRKKSIMQPITAPGEGEVVDCPDCKLRLELVESPPPPFVASARYD